MKINMDKKLIINNKFITVLLVICVITGAVFFLSSYLAEAKLTVSGPFPQEYRIVSPPMPESPSFCGEKLPVENFDIRERLERELTINTYYHSATLFYIKKAARWFPVIEPILKRNKIPEDIKYLAVIESGLENVVSPAGATGFWQFTEGSAAQYGLEVNTEVDERYHVEKSTQAACEFLKASYQKYGSWALAAASYNAGLYGVDRQIKRQRQKNYYNLLFSEETLRYVMRIVAVKAILEKPELYGYSVPEEEKYEPLKSSEIRIDGPIPNLADFAISKGINYKILKIYNPWLRDTLLTNKSRRTYMIKLPQEGSIGMAKE